MAAYEALKQKLSAEGLFDETRKQPIPVSPRIVGVVTSADGAAIRDIIKVAGRRDSSVKIRLYPVKVQGKGSTARNCSRHPFHESAQSL